jgi:hypothetical protein
MSWAFTVSSGATLLEQGQARAQFQGAEAEPVLGALSGLDPATAPALTPLR